MTALLYGSLMHDVAVQGEGNGWKQQGLATIAPGAVLERAEGPIQVTSKGLTHQYDEECQPDSRIKMFFLV